ncbi:MAG: hydrolase [Synergistaceae bacterium]|jgi:nicotinamidase-related amidase|nr:hydrolase [Synergistaceae bacterium]
MLSRLRRENTVFLMIDIQERLLPSISGAEEIVQNSVRLVKAAETMALPLLWTEQYPKGIGPTVKEISSVLPAGASPFEKTAFSCCDEPGFMEKVRTFGRPSIVIFGIETHICILSTVMDLLKEGYGVVAVADACGSRNVRNHDIALRAVQSRGALVVPVETVVYQLLGVSGTPEFKTLLPLFK